MTSRDRLKGIASVVALTLLLRPVLFLAARQDGLMLLLLRAATARELLACPQVAMRSNGDVMEVLKEKSQFVP